MVRQMGGGWGGVRTRGQLGRWGDLGRGSLPLLPVPLPPLPPPPGRGPGGGRVSIFSLAPAPHTQSTPSSAPSSAPGPPFPAVQAPGASQPRSSTLPTPATPATQSRPAMTPISAPPSWGSHSAPPPRRCPQDPPGLRIGPLVPEQVYERLDDCDPEGSQDSALHGEEQQPLLHVPEGLRGSWHHVQNLDSFFTKISFCALPGRRGTGGRETAV
ncbi:autophagy-related protein 9B-like [Balaenoptera musculus]|uniref:Autophagy-related protein 9B-like n=1 Tax=Balaenoptera musculus TaxID=9771 RepID=A0A8B8YKM9_BALMU|nr:autophagy-related protein 9B-like [Balaenoptera musculus]